MVGKFSKSASALVMMAALHACGGGTTDTVPMTPGLYHVVNGRGEFSEAQIRRQLNLPYPWGGQYCLGAEEASSTHLSNPMLLQLDNGIDVARCDQPGLPFTMKDGEIVGTVVCEHAKGPLEITYRGKADEEGYYVVVSETYAQEPVHSPFVTTVGAKRIGECDAE